MSDEIPKSRQATLAAEQALVRVVHATEAFVVGLLFADEPLGASASYQLFAPASCS